MSVVDLPLQDAPLRRIRSAGDIPRRTDLPHPGQASLRMSENSDIPDVQINIQPSIPATLSPRLVQSLETAPTAANNTNSEHQGFPDPLVAGSLDQQDRHQQRRSLYSRTLAYFGVGRGASHARKSLVSLIWNLSWGFSQVIVISTLLGLSGTVFKSPTKPGISEWKACDRPLGIWACLWIVRVALASVLAYWEFTRDRLSHAPRTEVEIGAVSPASSAQNPQLANLHGGVATRRANNTPLSPEDAQEPVVLPHTQLYSRLTLLSSLMTLTWFLTAHILEYTSVHTCRHSSPHLWWLTFGILCIMYLMVLEVLLLGFIVLIVAPILFVFWNIFLICIGRHPLQNPHMIKPEIGKLSKSVVDRIPLVMYIPPPPNSASEGSNIPGPSHSYPPKISVESRPPKHRFKFFRKIPLLAGKKGEAKASGNSSGNPMEKAENEEDPESWEGHWERSDYPFVVLEGNRAACAICLMDFEEPKRKNFVSGTGAELDGTPAETPAKLASSVPEISVVDEEEREEQLKLADAGDGAQPLRLLACGHVFHKTCLDPWLTDVSGRCPVCQRAVEILPSKRSRRERRRNP